MLIPLTNKWVSSKINFARIYIRNVGPSLWNNRLDIFGNWKRMNNNTGLEHESRNTAHRQKHFRAHVHGTNWISARFNYGKSRYNSVSFFPFPPIRSMEIPCRPFPRSSQTCLNVRVNSMEWIYMHDIPRFFTSRERQLFFPSVLSINFQIRTEGNRKQGWGSVSKHL